MIVAAVGTALLFPLAAARFLTPDAREYGTHEQLGLPPCTMVVLFGIRCPTCGTTTAFSRVARGELIAAFRANAAGALLALLSAPAGVWVCLAAISGRRPIAGSGGNAAVAVALGFLAIACVDWAIRLCFGY